MNIFAYIKLLGLSSFQEKIIFKPLVKGLETIQNPIEYHLPSTQEIYIHSGEDERKIYLWVKQPEDKKKPMVVFFQGNTGHLADVGPPERDEVYDRDYRIKFLKELTKAGFGFTHLSHSSYGKSEGKPSEISFDEDLESFAEFLQNEENEKIIIIGESLGAWSALTLNEKLLTRGVKVDMVCLIAPFTNIFQKAIDIDARFAKFKLEKYLRYKFDNVGIIENSAYKGKFLLFTPELDKTTGAEHSEKIFEAAKNSGMQAQQKILLGAEHIVWDNKEIVGIIEENL